MTPQLIIALVLAGASFLGGWTVQSWRYGAKEKARVEQQLQDQKKSAAVTLRRADNIIEAGNATVVKMGVLRRDADTARAVADRLRASIAATLRDAATSQAACAERATTLSELYEASATRRRELAEKADRHVVDVEACRAGWPQ